MHRASRSSRSSPSPAIARAHDATPAQVRLAWTLHRGPHVLAIPGTGDPVHLTENIDAAALRLSPQEIRSLAATPLPPTRLPATRRTKGRQSAGQP